MELSEDSTSSSTYTNKSNSPEEIEVVEMCEKLLPSLDEEPLPSETKKNRYLYFDDGVRRIDFIFAYKQAEDSDEETQHKDKRKVFQANLQKVGVDLEDVSCEDDETVGYVKVHAPWSVLADQAQLMNLKMPIAINDISHLSVTHWNKHFPCLKYDKSILEPITDHFTAVFSRDREKQFIMEDKENFFTPAQRSLLLYQILERCVFEDNDDESKKKFGLKNMIECGYYDAAYSLHEGDYKSQQSVLTLGKAVNNRHGLYETWARWGACFKFQPIDHIKRYFGEKIGIYFAWLGHYTGFLFVAAVFGLLVFIYGCGTILVDATSEEICNESGAGNFTMCPECDKHCSFWKLHESCLYSKVTHIFDNEATVFFAVFMALWVTCFQEMWKRRTSKIEYDWDVNDFEEEETIRPEFEATVKSRKLNQINQKEEPHVSQRERACCYIVSLWVILFMLLIVLAAIFGVIMYRLTVFVLLYAVQEDYVRQMSSSIISISAAVIDLVIIIFLGMVYKKIAHVLTNMEQHRTQTEWENSFTLKMFLFQFVNNYSSLFYIAFFKGRFIGRPGAYNRDLTHRQEECDPSGCLIDLLIQLAIIMIGKQAVNNVKEIFVLKLKNWCKSCQAKKNKQKEHDTPLWKKDYLLAEMPELGLFNEYLEMVLQFGFVTIFVAAFPLAPLFALINNIIEIRLDAYKFVAQWRRPLANRAQNIGMWSGILQGISAVAVASNACIIAFTSDFIPKLVYRYRHNDGSLHGYIDFRLSVFNVSDFEEQSIPEDVQYEIFGNVTFCRYRDFRDPPGSANEYEFSSVYWYILTARLAFIIVFILVIIFLQWIISFMVPDVPHSVKIQILREKHLAKNLVRDHLALV